MKLLILWHCFVLFLDRIPGVSSLLSFPVASHSKIGHSGSVSAGSFSYPVRRHSSTSRSSTTALAMAEGLTLYGHSGSRSPLVNWACNELGITLKTGDLRNNPHPFGQMPCLTDNDGDVVLFESGAILAYLIQNYYTGSSSSSSDVKILAAERAAILSWIVWANASLDPICFLETAEGKVYDTGLKQANKRIDRLVELLEKQNGVLVPSAGFSVADVAVASYLLYVVQFFPQVTPILASQWPTLVQYMKDAASRPTYGQAFGDDTQAYLVDKLSQSNNKKMFGMF